MLNSPYFVLFLSFAYFYLGILLIERFKNPIFNPLLISIIITIISLKVLGVSYQEYMEGGKYIHFMLTPITILLVIPLYKQLELFKKNYIVVLSGVIVGAVVSITSIVVLGKAMGLNKEILVSIMPKSVTSGVAMPLSEEFGGIPSIAAFGVIFTGILGAIFGDYILMKLGLSHPVVYGVSMGTSAHAVGTSKAMERGEKEGSLSGLCILLCGIFTVIIFPFFMKFI